MIAPWMLSAVAAAAVLGAVALLVERGLSHLGRPGRWTWLFVMVVSVALPFVFLALPGGGVRSPVVSAVVHAPAMGSASAPAPLPPVAGPVNAMPDALLLGAWLVTSALLVLVLVVSAATLRGHRQRWRSGTVSGERVFVSGWVGPAVVGAVRPRIVLPGWVLEMDPSVQRLIVLHEREHVRAGDSLLLVAGLLLLVLLPWCLPLWWQFHRLRAAIETDCDARLLGAGAPARDYAEVLLDVARRRRHAVLPVAALAPSKATLERRIRMIVSRTPSGGTRNALAVLGAATLILSVGAVALPVPRPPTPAALAQHFRGVLPDGSLPGDPGDERLAAAIRAHHADAIATGLPDGSVIWFVVDWSGAVVRTGIEQGTEREVAARVRARYPGETSDIVLNFSFAAGTTETTPLGFAGEVTIVWLLAER